jgi:uncharacterized protein YndB with AHSA1/START domain
MPVRHVASDPTDLRLTVVYEHRASRERLWSAWTDPRTLERFWGPPTWPATFTTFDLKVGGRAEYFMSGPEGGTARGAWRFLEIEPGHLLRMRDGFGRADGSDDPNLPSMDMEVRFEQLSEGGRVRVTTTFDSVEDMERVLAMGMQEGMASALAQLDEVLDDLRAASAAYATALELLDDTHVRIVRVVRGSLDQVWRAHHDPDLLKRWLLGPPGWVMTVAEPGTAVGAAWRYAWAQVGGEGAFGFEGEVLELAPPRRAVTTERMTGTEGPNTVNELTLAPAPGGRTRITLVITYPSRELRDMILATGMVDGMEQSYARLDGLDGLA